MEPHIWPTFRPVREREEKITLFVISSTEEIICLVFIFVRVYLNSCLKSLSERSVTGTLSGRVFVSSAEIILRDYIQPLLKEKRSEYFHWNFFMLLTSAKQKR